MNPLSQAEENYIKSIFHIQSENNSEVNTNAIAESLKTSAASVSDMLKKLSKKGLLNYEKYKGVTLTGEGNLIATKIIRKHRLWEVFLVEKLQFNWDQVHEIAEELEHIQSPLLINRLDYFLGYPKNDPHGDPIPNENGEFEKSLKITLAEFQSNKTGTVIGVKDTDSKLLKYLDKIGIALGSKIEILEIMEFDQSIEIKLNNKSNVFLSNDIAKNIYLN